MGAIDLQGTTYLPHEHGQAALTRRTTSWVPSISRSLTSSFPPTALFAYQGSPHPLVSRDAVSSQAHARWYAYLKYVELISCVLAADAQAKFEAETEGGGACLFTLCTSRMPTGEPTGDVVERIGEFVNEDVGDEDKDVGKHQS